ncbi:unnamed protein product, partial [Arabidopsis halleri]
KNKNNRKDRKENLSSLVLLRLPDPETGHRRCEMILLLYPSPISVMCAPSVEFSIKLSPPLPVMHPFRIFSSIVLSNSPLFFSIPLNDASGSELLFTLSIPCSYLQNSPLRCDYVLGFCSSLDLSIDRYVGEEARMMAQSKKACIRFFNEGQRIMLEIVKETRFELRKRSVLNDLLAFAKT